MATNRKRGRPFFVYVSTSHFSGGFNFASESDAFDYLHHQLSYTRRAIAERKFGNSWVGFDMHDSHIRKPDGSIVRARDVFFLERFDSISEGK